MFNLLKLLQPKKKTRDNKKDPAAWKLLSFSINNVTSSNRTPNLTKEDKKKQQFYQSIKI